MELGVIFNYSYQELASFTDNFCDNNYVSHFQFGKFYRGKIDHAEWTQYVLVKIWEISDSYSYRPGDNERRLLDEIALLRHEAVINHPGMIKLYGICIEGDRLGAVYDFKPFESVYNLIPKDGFGWLQRIKVALNLARLLKFLGTRRGPYKPYIVRNLDCAHVLLDEVPLSYVNTHELNVLVQVNLISYFFSPYYVVNLFSFYFLFIMQDYNQKICDFGLITGGIFPDRTIYRCHHVVGCYGYIDISAIFSDNYSPQIDVYAFGYILINLMSKRVYHIEDCDTLDSKITDWAREIYYEYDEAYGDADSNTKIPKFSIVHESISADPDFVKADEHKISTLAVECTHGWTEVRRPTIKQVLRCLLKLKVVKQHAEFF